MPCARFLIIMCFKITSWIRRQPTTCILLDDSVTHKFGWCGAGSLRYSCCLNFKICHGIHVCALLWCNLLRIPSYVICNAAWCFSILSTHSVWLLHVAHDHCPMFLVLPACSIKYIYFYSFHMSLPNWKIGFLDGPSFSCPLFLSLSLPVYLPLSFSLTQWQYI